MSSLIFLDFDGVICDSHAECLVSSWYAYHHLYLHANPSHVPRSLKEQFLKLRPFVRSGEDFLFLQELISKDVHITSQQDFNIYLKKSGSSIRNCFEELFYAARFQYRQKDREYWISLNRLYPHILEKLKSWAASIYFYILSTKKSDYIMEILMQYGIEMAAERVLYSSKQSKVAMISELLDEKQILQAVFVDDHIDHLLESRDPRIEPYLASWGYIKEEWLDNPRVKILTPDSLASLLDQV